MKVTFISFLKNLKSFFFYLLFTWKQELNHRNEFLVRFFLSAINSITLFSFWLAYSHKFNSINGWTIHEIAVLYATTHLVMGWLTLLSNGSIDILYLYEQSKISSELLDPGFPMARLIANGSSLHGLSQILIGTLYFVFSKYGANPSSYVALFTFSLLGSYFMSQFFYALNSLLLKIRNGHVINSQVYEVSLLFMMYPKNLFSGLVYSLSLTVVPVVWMVHFPAEAVINPDWSHISILIKVLTVSIALNRFASRILKKHVLTYGD